jgi:hypothetical protein
VTQRSERVYVFVARDENGDEGIPILPTMNSAIPMVGMDMERAEQLKEYAQQLADMSQSDVTLAIYEQRRDVQVFRPRADPRRN